MPPRPSESPASQLVKTVLGIGAATWDRFTLVPEFPSGEGVTQALGTAEQGGGPVATALCTLAALGTRAVLLDSQGDDATGRAILAELHQLGVRTDLIEIHPGRRSTHAQILVRAGDGARHIFFTPSNAPEPLCGLQLKDLLPQVDLVHLNGRHETAAREVAGLARAQGIPVSFDGGAGRFRESLRDLVLASDLRIVARDFALSFASTSCVEEAARALLEDSPRLVVITDGVRGADIHVPGGVVFHEPAVPAPRVVDTTGCGDVYHGAFLHGWLQGWSPRRCARLAARLASCTAGGLGGRCALAQMDAATPPLEDEETSSYPARAMPMPVTRVGSAGSENATGPGRPPSSR